MDPLSISMAILTIVASAKRTVTFANSVYNAPTELESLFNDLSDAEALIRNIKSYIEDNDETSSSPQEKVLQQRLVEAEGVVIEVKNLITKVVKKSNDLSSVRRLKWLKAKKKTRKLTEKLTRIHTNLPQLYGEAEESRIKLDLVNISNVQRQTNSGLSRLEEQLDTTTQSLSHVGESLVSSQQLQNQTISSLEDFRRGTSQRLQNLELIISANSHLLGTLPELLGVQIQTVLQSSTSTTTFTQASIGSSGEQTSETTTNVTNSTICSTYQSVMIRSPYRTPDTCELACQCRCHVPQTRVTPSLLSNLIGRMHVGYKGIPVLAKICTNARCKRDSQPGVFLSYFFPTWWMTDRMMTLLAKWSMARGPELVLRFPSRVSMNSPVFSMAAYGNIEGLKSLFDSGKASPNDVDEDGRSVLFHAYSWSLEHYTCRFLIQAGANLEDEVTPGRTIMDEFCRTLFTGRQPSPWNEWVSTTILSRRSEGFGFSSIHEILLRLRYTSLSTDISRLSDCPGALDVQDIWGHTPLHWACIRNDFEAVCLLLQSGANLEICDKVGNNALLMSAKGGSLDCAVYLLDYGAKSRSCSMTGWTALHYVCAYRQRSKTNIVAFLDRLRCIGVDIDARVKDGTFENALYLSLQTVSEHGNITLKWLLEYGADYKTKFRDHSTILHEAGKNANMDTIQILRDAQLYGIDIHARYSDTGKTAMDNMLDLDRPSPASSELIESFRQLLVEIEARTNEQADPTSKGRVWDIAVNAENSATIVETSSGCAKTPRVTDEEAGRIPEGSEDLDEEDISFEDSVEFQIAGCSREHLIQGL